MHITSPAAHSSKMVRAPRFSRNQHFSALRTIRQTRCRSPCVVQSAAQLEVILVEVEELKGVRLMFQSNGTPRLEYLTSWKGDYEDTWEVADNLSEDLLRDYEERWWDAVKRSNVSAVRDMLAFGGEVLAQVVDDSRRSALHFAAALGKPDMVQMLLDAGADVNLADVEGYTPLHLAAGYMQPAALLTLIDSGADPELCDKNGRNVVGLLDSLRANLPASDPQKLAVRMQLEEAAKAINDALYEDLPPAAVLDVRYNKDGVLEYLVQWPDDRDDEWVPQNFVSSEVQSDVESQLEYAEAECIVDMRRKGDAREYLLRWKDGGEDSWAHEDDVALSLVREWEAQARPTTTSKPSMASKPQLVMA